jgi:hypothetical protein
VFFYFFLVAVLCGEPSQPSLPFGFYWRFAYAICYLNSSLVDLSSYLRKVVSSFDPWTWGNTLLLRFGLFPIPSHLQRQGFDCSICFFKSDVILQERFETCSLVLKTADMLHRHLVIRMTNLPAVPAKYWAGRTLPDMTLKPLKLEWRQCRNRPSEPETSWITVRKPSFLQATSGLRTSSNGL